MESMDQKQQICNSVKLDKINNNTELNKNKEEQYVAKHKTRCNTDRERLDFSRFASVQVVKTLPVIG